MMTKYFLMNKETKAFVSILKDEIQSKFGRSISYANDCEELSELIKSQTNRQVSSSTLKRFFGIIKTSFNLSKYTLDTLSIFLEFDDWQEFLNNFEKEKHRFSQQETWDNLKKRTGIITDKSLKSLKNRIGTRFEYFPIRKFPEKKFENFLCSTKIATAFIAPDGYGKSTIVTQLTEKFFTGPDAKYPDDIVCLVDGSILYNLIIHHQRINGLYNLLEYNPQKSFSTVFRNNPDLVRGRFVFILDGIDDICAENEKTDNFIKNLLNIISSYEGIGWFKILITCSPKIWRMISDRMQKNQILKSQWFDVTFHGNDNDLINIPLLKKKEIKSILEKNHYPQSLRDLCFSDPDIIDIINNPYLLHLFLSSDKPAGTIRDIDLLNQYIKNTVLSPPYSNEKFLIIKSFFTLCGYGKKTVEIRKEDLNLSFSMNIAYNNLIRTGILYEYSITDDYLSVNTYVKFSHNVLFAYYLANMLLKENKLSIDLLRNIILDYNNSPALQCNILRYVIKIFFKDERVELLKNIFSIFDKDKLPQNTTTFNMPCYVMTNIIGTEMRRNQHLREILIPYYARSEAGRALYFEKFFDMDRLVLHSGNDLDYYLQYSQSNEAMRYVHFMKFMQHFLGEDEVQCKKEYENRVNLKFPVENDSFNAAFYFIPQLIYQSVFELKVDKNIIEDVYRVSERIIQNGIQNRTDIPDFEFKIIFALSFGRMNKEIIDLAHHIYAKYDMTNLTSSSFYQLFLSIYAKALLNTGEEQTGIDLFHQVEFRNSILPENLKNYIQIRYLLIEAEFLAFEGKLKKARQKIAKIKNISQMLKFNYFYNNAIELEKTLMPGHSII
jgi:hypothetical protein